MGEELPSAAAGAAVACNSSVATHAGTPAGTLPPHTPMDTLNMEKAHPPPPHTPMDTLNMEKALPAMKRRRLVDAGPTAYVSSGEPGGAALAPRTPLTAMASGSGSSPPDSGVR